MEKSMVILCLLVSVYCPANTEGEIKMDLKITCDRPVPRATRIQILIPDKKGKLIPCYHKRAYSCDQVVDSTRMWLSEPVNLPNFNYYIPSGDDPIDPENLVVINRITREFRVELGFAFDRFIADLMNNPPSDEAQFIRYEGADKIPSLERLFGIFSKTQTSFLHHLSICKLKEPFNQKYQNKVTKERQEKERLAAKRESRVQRLKAQLLPPELKDRAMSSLVLNNFKVISLAHTETSTDKREALSTIIERTKDSLVRKAPIEAEKVILTRMDVAETPETFFRYRSQIVNLYGIALIPKRTKTGH